MQEDLLDPTLGDDLNLGGVHHWLSIRRSTIKRALDFIVASIIFLLVLPLFVFILVAIALTGMPPIYPHQRVDRNGREFGCLKFRAIQRDSDRILVDLLRRDPRLRRDWETNRKLRWDPRVTRLGRVLRMTGS